METVIDFDGRIIELPSGSKAAIEALADKNGVTVEVSLDYRASYGMGEHFSRINYKNHTIKHLVKEVFCNQGDDTYISIPFFVTDAGMGMYIDCDREFEIEFGEKITFSVPAETEIELYTGTPLDIIAAFNNRMGHITPIGTEYLGPWISANHWNSEEKTYAAVRTAKELGFPVSVIVLEAWSDEATFYIFNGAEYEVKTDGSAYTYEDFDFSESKYWHDPKGMIQKLKDEGISTVLWQIPVYKKLSENEAFNKQNSLDEEKAIREGLCVYEDDGTPYRIPKGNWFEGSLIPDFTNARTKEDWFAKRKYLLDIGVSGFKTDGGEFIYKDNLKFADGKSGRDKKNTYCQDYVDSYSDFVGNDRILFSRAGTKHSAQTPAHWAGDHQSTNDELRNVFIAAMSAAASGIIYWSFDIGGFAGPMPSLDLYRRATQFAVFTPIMQWHSEPDGGQFKEIMAGAEGNNERSPWNIAALYDSPNFLEEMRYWHNLRMELIPYIYEELKDSAAKGIPLMRPLVLTEFCEESGKNMELLETEYFFGSKLLVAPLLNENEMHRDVYLPDGRFKGFFSGTEYEGGRIISSKAEKYPVYELIQG